MGNLPNEMMRRCAALACVVAAAAPSPPELALLPLPARDDAGAWRLLGLRGLHVGSGLGLPAGCLNTDVDGVATGGVGTNASAPFARVAVDDAAAPLRFFLQHDATRPFPVAAGSFDWVFAEHFIEHVPRAGALAFLREARRLLGAGGGVVRLSTPDLALYVAAYADPAGAFVDAHHAAMTTGPMAGFNGDLRKTGPALLNALFHDYGHGGGYIYDGDELLRLVGDAGLLRGRGGDCDVELGAFRTSRALPDVARALDDPVKAHESLYADLVCGDAGRWPPLV